MSSHKCLLRGLLTRSRVVEHQSQPDKRRSEQTAHLRWSDVDARNRTLPEWFNRMRSGQIKLPRFQRYEAWGHNEIASLLEAVLRGLPAGAALVLEIGDREPFISRTMVGAPAPTERPNEHLLDGQQRLTAVWRSFHDLYPDRTYLVRLEDDVDHEGEQIWTVLGQARWHKKDRLYPLWVDDPSELRERDLIPLRLLQPGDVMSMIREWCDRATNDDVHASRDLESQILELRTRVATYNVPYLSLPVGTPKDVALEVFIKMNTSSVRLSAFDVVVAQLEEATGESLHDLVDTLRAKVPSADAYRDPGTWVLDVAALREDHPPTQASYQRLDLDRVHREWDEIVDGIGWAVSFLEEEHVFDGDRLPTVAVLPILAALSGHLPTDPDALGNARMLLRRYAWRAFLTRRYEQSVGSRSLQDYRGLRGLLIGGPNDVPTPILDEVEYPLPGIEELIRAGWPKNKEILARGILAASLRAGARDLADDALIARQNVRTREYHHLFPNAVLTGDGALSAGESYRALNCALITWRTNRKISAKSPLRYLREHAEATTLGEPAVRQRLRSHLIPYTELSAAGWDDIEDKAELRAVIGEDFDRFLKARAELLLQPLRDLCDGQAPVEEWLVSQMDADSA